MISGFLETIKGAFISVIPVMVIVLLLHFTMAPLLGGQIYRFLLGGGLLILGLSIFLKGAESGMVYFGQKVGSALTRKRSLPLILVTSFVIGFAVTIAEPDVQVLATQVSTFVPSIDRDQLLIAIAAGIGLFLLIGTGRIILQIPLRILFVLFYILVFAVCAMADTGLVGVAFDAGGVTTGPVTMPFVIALGIGVAGAGRGKEGRGGSFGLIGLASIGPVIAVAGMGIFSPSLGAVKKAAAVAEPSTGILAPFLDVLPKMAHEITLALLPLLIIFIVFQIALLRLPFQQVKRILLGILYAFIGLVTFMTGVVGGFTPTGLSLGFSLALLGPAYLIIAGLIIGGVVVCAEPAIWILTKQIEDLSGGYIKRTVLLAVLSVSIGLAVALGMLKASTGAGIWWIIAPGYALALILTRFSPPLFTAIAFDSGGVAAGPMATTFVLSMSLGASHALGESSGSNAFGMIAVIAMTPLITIQILGLIFNRLENKRRLLGQETREQESMENQYKTDSGYAPQPQSAAAQLKIMPNTEEGESR